MKRRDFTYKLATSSLGLVVLLPLQSCVSSNKITKASWEQIRANSNEAFAYVHPQKGVPNVLLYGDSISIGYTPSVRKELDGKASVFRIFNNGQSSHEFIPKMEQLQQSMFKPHLKGGWNFKWDVIHFNVGLHDLKYVHQGKLDLENGTQVSSLSVYQENLHGICKYLQENFPRTQLIFATTTPVPENCEGRVAGDAVKYNKVALEVLQDYPSILINDLYAYTRPHHEKWMIKPGNVHYNELGKTEQGKRVAEVILNQLN